MANWDGCALTNLIIECHRRMVRVSIGPNMRTMKIQFWQRKSRAGSISERLPDIEEMVKSQDEQWGRITIASTGHFVQVKQMLDRQGTAKQVLPIPCERRRE